MNEDNKQDNENKLNEVPDGMVLAESPSESIYCM